MKIFILLLTLLFINGCTAVKQPTTIEDIYSTNEECNGELNVNHSITLGTNEEGKVNEPKITVECEPTMYDPQTDFEKENRKEVNHK